MKTEIITFAHYKGGTGKTTSCINIAGYLAKSDKKVLIVDLDPQGNATSGLGIDKNSLDYTMFHVMNKKKNIKQIILETEIPNLHVAPANQELEKTNLKTYTKKSDALNLKNTLEKIKDYYDFILIDTPPVHGHFIINGMASADKVIIVLDPGIFALEGISTLQNFFGDYFKKLKIKLNIEMALITKTQYSIFPWKNKHINEVKKEVEDTLKKDVFTLPFSNLIYETHANGLPISHYKSFSNIGRAYNKITSKILENGKNN